MLHLKVNLLANMNIYWYLALIKSDITMFIWLCIRFGISIHVQDSNRIVVRRMPLCEGNPVYSCVKVGMRINMLFCLKKISHVIMKLLNGYLNEFIESPGQFAVVHFLVVGNQTLFCLFFFACWYLQCVLSLRKNDLLCDRQLNNLVSKVNKWFCAFICAYFWLLLNFNP